MTRHMPLKIFGTQYYYKKVATILGSISYLEVWQAVLALIIFGHDGRALSAASQAAISIARYITPPRV